jgi:phosphatidylglycerol:prolipoprotein diacylglycerol transferase
MIILAWVIGVYLCVKNAEKHGIQSEVSLNAMLFAFIFGIIGARIYHLVQNYRFFLEHPDKIIAMWEGGFASIGGFGGGSMAAIIYLKKKNISIRRFADCCAPAMAFSIFLARIGCFLNGCCFGKLSTRAWAVRFPRGSGPYIQHLAQGYITISDQLSLPVHPTQLYYSFAGLLLFVFLIVVPKNKLVEGQLFLSFVLLYSISCFIIEFYRADVVRGFGGFLTLGQVLNIFISIVALALSIFFIRKQRVGGRKL